MFIQGSSKQVTQNNISGGGLFTQDNTYIGDIQPVSSNIIFWFKPFVDTPIQTSTLTRTNIGKILYDDFSSGISTWSLDAGEAITTTDGAKQVVQIGPLQTELTHVIASDRTIFAQCSIKNVTSSPSTHMGFDLVSGSNKYEFLTYNNNVWIFYDGTTITNTATLFNNSNYHIVGMNVHAAGIDGYMNGSNFFSINNTQLTSFDKIRLALGGVGGPCMFDKVSVMSSDVITCTGLPTGYGLKVGTEQSYEVNGTATVQVQTLEFPISSISAIDASGNDVKGFTATSDVWAGDTYAY